MKKPQFHTVSVRLPIDLHAKLTDETGGSPRGSLNAEIVERLTETFQPLKADDVVRSVASVRTLINRAGHSVLIQLETADGTFNFSVPADSFMDVAAQMMADAKMIEGSK